MKKLCALLALTAACMALCGNVAAEGDGVVWHDPLSVKGVIQNRIGDDAPGYCRLPESLKPAVTGAVWGLSNNSAGLAVHFYTNSPEITVRYKVKGGMGMPHMSPTGVTGVDMYRVDGEGEIRRCFSNIKVDKTTTWIYKAEAADLYHKKGFEYRLYLPLYNTVESLEIGTVEDSEFRFMRKRTEKPIVIYGTSITQGACASRPGMAWTHILGRNLDWPVVNLGFSGNGRLDAPVIDFMASEDAALYILDCMANLSSSESHGENVAERIRNAVRSLRKATDTPILLLAHPGFGNMVTDPQKRVEADRINTVLFDTFKELENEGLADIHLVDYVESCIPEDGRVDYVHFTDYGMQKMAEAVEPVVRELMNLRVGDDVTMRPVTQRREPDMYEWLDRHEAHKVNIKKARPRAAIIGDSITHYWEGEVTCKNGAENWAANMLPEGFFSLGCGWDRLENMLWRVQHGALDGVELEQVYLWAGTNNVARDSDEDIIAGLGFLLDAIESRQPSAEIVVMGLLPMRDMEDRVEGLNRRIKKMARERGLEFRNPGKTVVDRKGKMVNTFFKDGLHPNEAGYGRIAPIFTE